MEAGSPPPGRVPWARAARDPSTITTSYKYVLAFRQRERKQLAELLLTVEALQGDVLTLQQENRVLQAHEKLLTLTLGEHAEAALANLPEAAAPSAAAPRTRYQAPSSNAARSARPLDRGGQGNDESPRLRAAKAYLKLVGGAYSSKERCGRQRPRDVGPHQAAPHHEALALLQRLPPIEYKRLAATNLAMGKIAAVPPTGHWQKVASEWLPSPEEAQMLSAAMRSFQADIDREAAVRRAHITRLNAALMRATDARQLAVLWVTAELGSDEPEAVLSALSAQLEHEARAVQVMDGVLALIASERSAYEVAVLSWPYLASWVQVCAAKISDGGEWAVHRLSAASP